MSDLLLEDDDVSSQLQADVQALRQAWLNEKNAPELLPFQGEVLRNLTEQIENQQTNIASVASASVSNAFFANLYQMEVDRLKYMIRSYLRTRLTKIQKYVFYILKTQEQRLRLSAEEFEFARGYVTLLESHFNESCLKDFPEGFQSLDQQTQEVDMIPRPDLDAHIFCQVKEDIGDFEIEPATSTQSGGSIIALNSGDQYILRYQPIRQLVESSSVVLL